MAPKRKKRNRKDDGFGFITDARLRGDIKIALGFSSYLIRLSAKAQKNYKRELRRVVILYTASVVEALCLFLIKQNNLSKEKLEYKYARTIVMPGVSLPKGNTQVVALQEKIPLFLTDIPFFDAINILRKEKILTDVMPDLFRHLYSYSLELKCG